jgi:hypothetical protein
MGIRIYKTNGKGENRSVKKCILLLLYSEMVLENSMEAPQDLKQVPNFKQESAKLQ